MDKGGLAGTRGTVGPELVGGIELGGEHEAVFAAEAFQQVGILSAIQASVDGNDRIFLEHLFQPLVDGGVVTHILLHHHETAVFQLDFSLQEIAGIGPQGSLIEGYHGGAVTASEATNPVTEFPVVTDVFTLVRVGAGNDDGIHIQAAHLVAQRLKMRKSLSTHCSLYLLFDYLFV